MPDIFEDRSAGLESPAYNAVEVTPDDTADLAMHSRGLFVGGAGNIHAITAGGDEVTFVNVQPGILPVRICRVFATGTTATYIVAVW
ncbi:MAG: hypothetical protein AAGB15_12565 [Pseudomonadota bacterium]